MYFKRETTVKLEEAREQKAQFGTLSNSNFNWKKLANLNKLNP
jgi:hypothetical protein